MKSTTVAASFVALLVAALPTYAHNSAPKKPPAKKPTVGTLGTSQMKGGDGLFGTTYTLANSGGYIYNVTIVSAEYSAVRHNINANTTLAPSVGDKLLILHIRAQNPKPSDAYFSANFISFSTVAKDDKTRDHNDYLRLINAKETCETTLKPGQKFPAELLMACVVPADGPVPKLILNMGRKGTSEEVTRYFLGKAPNTIKPLAAPYADPADPTGSTALKVIPATIGTTYSAGYYDITLNSVAFAPGPIGNKDPGDGKRLLVATVTVTNKSWHPDYFKDNLAATLVTADDEKTTDYTSFKGKRDEAWDGRKIDPDETVTLRLLFIVPKDTTGKTLNICEILDNTGTQSKSFLYDVSAAK